MGLKLLVKGEGKLSREAQFQSINWQDPEVSQFISVHIPVDTT